MTYNESVRMVDSMFTQAATRLTDMDIELANFETRLAQSTTAQCIPLIVALVVTHVISHKARLLGTMIPLAHTC